MIICFTIDSFGDLLFQEKTMMRGEVNGAGEEKTTYIDATWNDGEEHINNFLNLILLSAAEFEGCSYVDCSILKYKLMSQ